MAPDLALDKLTSLKKGSLVLDPMAGSGTVLRQAVDLGYEALGYDVDPLAVLMARVWTTPVSGKSIAHWTRTVLEQSLASDLSEIRLPWIDEDPDNDAFVKYWFGPRQRQDLRRISYALFAAGAGETTADSAAIDVLRLALSRIIITKEQKASLARDTSHSRPHKVAESSDFEVFPAFEATVQMLSRSLLGQPPRRASTVSIGDARNLVELADSSVDAVLTSPPYLNAIDYLRGHRLALVWLGYDLKTLRHIRSNSIGAERAPDVPDTSEHIRRITDAMGPQANLPSRYRTMIDRYAQDLHRMTAEATRVLRLGGTATFVVGNSCLKGVFIRNADGLAAAAEIAGLTQTDSFERSLPVRKRYLPITTGGALSKRMRTETISSFVK